LSNYMNIANKEKIDAITQRDKSHILDFFVKNVDDVEIIDHDLRPKTMIFLGKKKEGDDLEMVMEEEMNSAANENKVIKENNENDKNNNLNKPKEILDPHLVVIDYLNKIEKRTVNRNSVLRSFTNHYSFENLLKICQKHFMKAKPFQNAFQEQVSFLDELLSGESDFSEKKAIIVVPNKYIPGNLCIENAKDFFVDSKYVAIEQDKAYTPLTTFKKNIKGKEVFFEIYNNVRNFEKTDWKRVVAVFVQGVEWEFNDWPKSETIISILLKIKGFHLKYNDAQLNENLKKWNIKILEIHRNKRHFDGSVNNEFWTLMEEFLNLPRYREKVNAKNK